MKLLKNTEFMAWVTASLLCFRLILTDGHAFDWVTLTICLGNMAFCAWANK